jgi:uncharacterized protein RhaS with RHS repeats
MKLFIAPLAHICELLAVTEVLAERDLETGGVLSRDPAGFVDGPNVYTYVNQNPWTAFDPDGLFKVGSNAIMGLYTTPAVHETITSSSLIPYLLTPRGANLGGFGNSTFQQFDKGLNEGVRKPDTQGWSTTSPGIPMGFTASYLTAEAHIVKGDMFANHFGDEQDNHAMSGNPAFMHASDLSRYIQSKLSSKFDAALTASAKGEWEKAGELLGEVCHTVQDSYSPSHTGRDGEGRITNFNDYNMQDGGAHGKADTMDMVRQSDKHNLELMKKNISGVTEACKATEGVFDAFFKADNPSNAFKNHMARVFETTSNAKINVSGGKKYEKK